MTGVEADLVMVGLAGEGACWTEEEEAAGLVIFERGGLWIDLDELGGGGRSGLINDCLGVEDEEGVDALGDAVEFGLWCCCCCR